MEQVPEKMKFAIIPIIWLISKKNEKFRSTTQIVLFDEYSL